jgi:hypothetical protein
MRWSYLMHLGYNMWDDRPWPGIEQRTGRLKHRLKSDTLQCDRMVWNAVTAAMSRDGLDRLVIDVAEGVQYQSHPELAVRGAWTIEELNAEVRRLRTLGIEAIPKLNFSTAHDAWLGDYAFMVSSPTYYRVCADLITELTEVFEQPKLFHIGMDEETPRHQARYSQTVIRQHELWYHDLAFFAARVEAAGARPWMWADRVWHHEREFLENVPKSILQSNWYYSDKFSFSDGDPSEDATYVRAYQVLEDAGYDQIPCGSNVLSEQCVAETVRHCDAVINPDRLLGYMVAPWSATVPELEGHMLAAVDQIGVQIGARQSGEA